MQVQQKLKKYTYKGSVFDLFIGTIAKSVFFLPINELLYAGL